MLPRWSPLIPAAGIALGGFVLLIAEKQSHHQQGAVYFRDYVLDHYPPAQKPLFPEATRVTETDKFIYDLSIGRHLALGFGDVIVSGTFIAPMTVYAAGATTITNSTFWACGSGPARTVNESAQ